MDGLNAVGPIKWGKKVLLGLWLGTYVGCVSCTAEEKKKKQKHGGIFHLVESNVSNVNKVSGPDL